MAASGAVSTVIVEAAEGVNLTRSHPEDGRAPPAAVMLPITGLALPGGEPAPELHVTLAYLGRRSDLEFRAPLAQIAEALRLVTAAPLEGAIGGVGRFSKRVATSTLLASAAS